MTENKKYSQPVVVVLGTTSDLIQGDKMGPGESGLEALQIVDLD